MEKEFLNILREKILILDGAMGTMIQNHNLNEEDFRGVKFKNWNKLLKGNNDILNITRPELIYEIHTKYLEAGADIIETNTFNSTGISQADYDCEKFSFELNFEGARIAKKSVKEFKKISKTFKFVAGVLGPTNRTCSMSPDVNDPGFRNVDFDQLKNDYKNSIAGLLEGGADLIFIETIFDTLNAKAALMAVFEIEEKIKKKIPIMISVTIADLSGRTLSGQTLEAFYNSVIHSSPLSIGLNCALGPKEIEPYLLELSKISETFVSVHSNAGLPNAFGEYDETPKSMANYARNWSNNGYINIIGGCCGTNPQHIKAIKEQVSSVIPREIPKNKKKFRLSGLEQFSV